MRLTKTLPNLTSHEKSRSQKSLNFLAQHKCMPRSSRQTCNSIFFLFHIHKQPNKLTYRQTGRHTLTYRHSYTHRHTQIHTDTQTQTQTQIHTDTNTHRHTLSSISLAKATLTQSTLFFAQYVV